MEKRAKEQNVPMHEVVADEINPQPGNLSNFDAPEVEEATQFFDQPFATGKITAFLSI